MNTTRWPGAALVLSITVGLISGCGSSAATQTQSGAAAGNTAGAGATAKASAHNRAVKFSECMRAHGLQDFPDPSPAGDFRYGISVSPTVWQRVLGECKYLQPPGSLSAKRTPAEQSAALRFAQCMRVNGVKDFPDPQNGQPLINTYRIPSSSLPGGMTILNSTIQKCRSDLSAAARGQ